MEASIAIPPMGTPEFRQFVQTPEWMEMQHGRALEDDQAWEAQRQRDEAMDEFYRSTVVYRLGATAHLDPRVWSRDWRERLAVDHPDRMDYEESIFGLSERDLIARDVVNLGKLHEATLRVTTLDR